MSKKTNKKQTNKRKYELEKKRKRKKIAIAMLVLLIIVGSTLFGVLYGLKDIFFPTSNTISSSNIIITDLKNCYMGNKDNYVEDSTSTITFDINIDGTTVKQIKGDVGYDISQEYATLVYDFSKICPELKDCKLLHYDHLNSVSIKLKNGYLNIQPYNNTNTFPYTLYLNTYTRYYSNTSIISTDSYVKLYYFRDSEKYLSRLNNNIKPLNFCSDYYQKSEPRFKDITYAYPLDPSKYTTKLNCHFFVNGKHTSTVTGQPVAGFESYIFDDLKTVRINEMFARCFLPSDFNLNKLGNFRYCASNITKCYYTFRRSIDIINNKYETYYATLYGGVNRDNNEPALYLKEITSDRDTYTPLGTGDIFFFYFT